MKADVEKLKELFNKAKSNFEIVQMTEVFRKDDDGVKTTTIGYFRKEHIAKAFAGAQADANWHETAKAVVLTDGVVAYLVDVEGPLKIFNDEEEALKLREKAIAKLSPEDCIILGLK